jgi:hypothetical protein
MEWEELQSSWTQLSQEVEQQKKITSDIIMEMTQQKFKNRFSTLTQFETIGAIICYAIAILIIINFKQLNTWYLELCGVLTLVYLVILPTMVLHALGAIQKLNIIHGNYKDNLLRYIKAKNNLLRLQRTGIIVGFGSLFISLPVMAKLLNNKDLFEIGLKSTAMVGLGIVVVLMFFFSRWGYRGYQKVTISAENMLRELE